MWRASIFFMLWGCVERSISPPPPPPLEPLEVSVRGPEPVDDDAPPVIMPTDLPPHVKLFDLGVLPLAGGVSGEIVVDVIGGLGAITLLVYGHEGGQVILHRALDPDGAAIVDDAPRDDLDDTRVRFARGFPSQVFSINRVFASPMSGAFMVPNTPAVEPRAGKWRFVVGQFIVDPLANPPTRAPLDRPVHVVVLVNGRHPAGFVDLNVHAAAPMERAFLEDTLAVIRDAYAAAAIEIREVRMRQIGDEFSLVRLLDDQCIGGDLDRLLVEESIDQPGIDLFFIERFSCLIGEGIEIGDAIGGSSAGLPGPPWVHGTIHSGVAVAVGFANGDARKLGIVAAHEIGHFLGLYHTRESSIGEGEPIFDEIEDTPNDDSAIENLMYFAADDDLTLTRDQGIVLRASAWVTP